ncbi:MAG: hypothetical protein E2O68_03930 [Deltaproteobacteria bacterium]|nr:MAG: hypothetical protein E2O68_03930 [Deltaproteobacteria bacterium]
MKYTLIFFGIIILITSAFLFLIFSPYFIYLKAINQGYSSSFLTLGASEKFMLKPQEFKIKKIDEFLAQNERRWKSFHFGNYRIPLPLQHPTLSLLPVIVERKGQIYFGGNIIDLKNSHIFKFVAGDILEMDYQLEKQKLFELPVFKEDLEGIPKNKFFKILFTHDVHLKKIDKKTKLSYMRSLWNIPYSDLVFNLFVINARAQFFPEKMTGFSFYPEKEMGVVETADKNPNYYNEIIFILKGDDIYTFKYRVKKGSLMADAIRTRFLRILKLQKSYEDKRIEAYNDFRALTYAQKISSVGFTYLYAGFTHVPDDLTYYLAMIRDLEKRPDNARLLTPLYQYGKRKFKIEEKKAYERDEESAQPTGLDERDKQIIKEATKEVENTELDEDSLTKEEKIDFYLKESKQDQGLESEEGVLEMD